MNHKLVKIIAGMIMLAIVADLGYLHWRFASVSSSAPGAEVFNQPQSEVSAPGADELALDVNCSDQCLALVQEEVARVVATISGQKTVVGKTDETVVRTEALVVPIAPRISYLPLGSGGESINTEWIEAAGTRFVFDLEDYNSGASVTWEANLRAEHANSRCFARIWDVSNLRAVDFSEQTTDSTGSVNLVSLPLSIWRGKNDYYLEIKSLNGIRCYLSSPRLKIVD